MNSLHCSFNGSRKNPPLLLLHGFLGSRKDWNTVTNELSSDFNCIALDLPGHGLANINDSKDSYSIENTASYIIEFLHEYKIRNCNLLGYSMGGRIALFLTIHFQKYFNKIMIESAQPGIKDEIQRDQRKIHDSEIAHKLKTDDFPDFLDFWYNQPIFKTLKKHKNFANLIQSRLNNNPHKLAKALQEIGTGAQPSLWEDLKTIENECLLIAGEFDTKYQKIFSKMHKEIYSSKFVVLKNCGHNTHFENPKEFTKVVKKFLSM